ncbi:MAG: LamG domain-containing protein [bacterium]|nr:LamG domain-containing protein [Gammaproteobacteria bacterium]HIL96662.1 LamG domain-containing protein [Pseudomonadales bacterium]
MRFTGLLFKSVARVGLTGLLVSILSACSGGAGQETEENPDLAAPAGSSQSLVLNGPAALTTDVQGFRVNLWENIAPDNRCGQCHGSSGQSPSFARNDDINLAYEQVNPIVDLNQPSQSRMVSKVGGGHNCWLDSDQACADILATWISNWAGDSAGTSNAVELRAPTLRDPGASKSFPSDPGVFASTVHPLLLAYCSNCHTDTAANPQSPFFAVSDVIAAYAAARSKIEIDDPPNSRLVVRLGGEFHNCWTDCNSNASEMLAAIETFVASIPETAVDPDFVTSRSLTLLDGIVASGGGRVDTNVIALYQFKTLSGSIAYDTSGVEPSLDLSFSGDVSWIGGWGINIGDNGKAQGLTSTSKKLHDLITSTGEYSLEAWIASANVTQEEARIVSYSGGNMTRNFTLGQTLYNYDFLARSSTTDGNGDPAISTPDADEVLQATLQHVVATFDPTNGRQLYVNGSLIDVRDGAGGTLNDWDDTFAFALGNEVSGDRLWRGLFKLVAIHNRVLTPGQVLQNFDAGVGERFFFLFGISHLINVPEAYIVFEVSQFDSYSYLFSQPYFISLTSPVTFQGIALRGMRIGINGREPEVGQAYSKLDITLDDSLYSAGTGQPLSAIGTILGIEKGADSDEFFLTFEQLGTHSNVRVEAVPDPLPTSPDGDALPDIGIKKFDEINASMSSITGVPTSNLDVLGTFLTVRQQLPVTANIEGFLSSQQMGVTQLAIEYCSSLVEDPVLRGNLFPAFDFNAVPVSAFDTAGRDALLIPLMDVVLGVNLGSQPDRNQTRTELESLITNFASSGTTAERTRTIVKATCAAVLGGAAMLIQ